MPETSETAASKRTAILQEIARKLPQYAGVLGEIDAALWNLDHKYDPMRVHPAHHHTEGSN